MNSQYNFYDLDEKQLPDGKGVLSAENYSNEVGKFIDKNKGRINSTLNNINHNYSLDKNKLNKDFRYFIEEYFSEAKESRIVGNDIKSYLFIKLKENGLLENKNNYDDILFLFLESLIDLMKYRVREDGINDSMDFISNISNSILPLDNNNIFMGLDLSYFIKLLTSFFKTPELFKQAPYYCIVPMIMEKLSVIGLENNNSIELLLDDKTDLEKLDIIFGLNTLVYSLKEMEGEGYFSGEKIYGEIISIILMIKDANLNPLINYFLDSILSDINSNNIDYYTDFLASDKNMITGKYIHQEEIKNMELNGLTQEKFSKNMSVKLKEMVNRVAPGLEKGILPIVTTAVFKISKDYYVAYNDNKEPVALLDNKLSSAIYYDELNNKEDVTFSNNYDQVGDLINNLHSFEIKQYFENTFNFELENISLKSQIHLLKFIYGKTQEEVDKFKNILNNNSEIKYKILESFLAVSEYKEMSDIILRIADSNITTLDKKIIFDKYINLLDELFITIGKESEIINDLDKNQLYKDSIKKLNELFAGVHEILDDDDPYDYEDDLKEIDELLDNTKQEYIESGIFFKNMKDKHIDSLEDLKEVGIEYKKLNSKELNEKQKIEIINDFRKLYKENYDEKTQGVFVDEMIDGLEKDLENNKIIDFYLFYIDGKPVLSSYFKEENGEKYFGGFNGSGVFSSYGFGFWALENIFEEQGKNHDINALILQDTDDGDKVIENKLKELLEKKYGELGFKIAEIIKIGSSTYLEIIRYKYNKDSLLSS